ncbi:MAG: hypothetical protein A2845_05145 [Candidatus Lloydbacteria bacterium RIFCSPHIGHO2_01_FULL_49_22]|uniref:Type II secretion system protein GspG C-terminal domain-containing protein n=1 Tax=Candidatus Lloydbacteria bacterium RIFCSPHIGHO2_01_FULL_49_22 TaxID=1798658 RepID=A0A1G2CTY6_9BACT|nr:MAG: hypothetical protein A2845_05145 [Candidatus Lloydbacteria bacterium RIFCSPHIGHO2_01_FULL_49_22]OGZ09514.1 MAG: hypothetical protein A3C14_01700 [Candidatus Lloydbacteria bacterium RIFCSPHIGHO2_02_FULL_50_18]
MHHPAHKRGFTLIELLVVIAIVGLLSSVILASLSTARQKARDAKRVAEMDSISKALELYYVEANSYPPTTPSGFIGSDAALQMLVTRGALSSLPSAVAPSTGYFYYGTNEEGTPVTECATVEPCQGYILAVELERDDHPSLQSDQDVALAALSFDGLSADCFGAVGPERCYEKVK